MAREKAKHKPADCKSSGYIVKEVGKFRKIKMEGKRGQQSERNAFTSSKVSDEKHEGLTNYRSALKRSTALESAKVEARALRACAQAHYRARAHKSWSARASRSSARDHDPN